MRQIQRLGKDPCPKCCRLREAYCGPVEIVVRGGKQWPDILPSLYVPLFSARVRQVLEDMNVAFESEPARIVKASKQFAGPPPDYFMLRVPGGLDIDLEASNFVRLTVCPECGSILNGGLTPRERLVPLEDTWNGSPFFTLRMPRMPQYYCCTIEFIEAARAGRWRNFHFAPLDQRKNVVPPPPGINYLGTEWPPKDWYPGEDR
jgi:hypothetical protein